MFIKTLKRDTRPSTRQRSRREGGGLYNTFIIYTRGVGEARDTQEEQADMLLNSGLRPILVWKAQRLGRVKQLPLFVSIPNCSGNQK